MSTLDDVRTLIELACLTEDRSDNEQKALLRIAVRADKEANATVVTNRRRGEPWRLHRMVEGTRVVSEWPGDKQHHIAVKDDVRARLDAQADAYVREQQPGGHFA